MHEGTSVSLAFLEHMGVFFIQYTFCYSSRWFHRGDPQEFDLMTPQRPLCCVSQHPDVWSLRWGETARLTDISTVLQLIKLSSWANRRWPKATKLQMWFHEIFNIICVRPCWFTGFSSLIVHFGFNKIKTWECFYVNPAVVISNMFVQVLLSVFC